MDHKQFQDWLSGIDRLSPAQRQQAEAVFPGDADGGHGDVSVAGCR